MTTVVHVACFGTTSLRDRVVHDTRRLERYGLYVHRTRRPGRNPGWAKLGTDPDVPGVINLEWDAHTRALLARIVTRGKGKPDQIIGLFVGYLLGRHRRRIRSITIHPE